jgi:hypothetical protein
MVSRGGICEGGRAELEMELALGTTLQGEALIEMRYNYITWVSLT